MRKLFFAVLLALAATVQAADGTRPAAIDVTPTGPDVALEKHVMALSEELRCLVCQNQTIADSHAELAIDLRNQVREQIVQGKSDKDVIDYMVQRYGDFVLYRPPVKGITWLLWFGPFLLMIGGVALLWMKLARGRSEAQELAQGDMERAAQLLGESTHHKDTQ